MMNNVNFYKKQRFFSILRFVVCRFKGLESRDRRTITVITVEPANFDRLYRLRRSSGFKFETSLGSYTSLQSTDTFAYYLTTWSISCIYQREDHCAKFLFFHIVSKKTHNIIDYSYRDDEDPTFNLGKSRPILSYIVGVFKFFF